MNTNSKSQLAHIEKQGTLKIYLKLISYSEDVIIGNAFGVSTLFVK